MKNKRKSHGYLATVMIAIVLISIALLFMSVGLLVTQNRTIGKVEPGTDSNTLDLPNFSDEFPNTIVLQEPFVDENIKISSQLAISIGKEVCKNLFDEELTDDMILSMEKKEEKLFWQGISCSANNNLLFFTIDAFSGDVRSAYSHAYPLAYPLGYDYYSDDTAKYSETFKESLKSFDYASALVDKISYYNDLNQELLDKKEVDAPSVYLDEEEQIKKIYENDLMERTSQSLEEYPLNYATGESLLYELLESALFSSADGSEKLYPESNFSLNALDYFSTPLFAVGCALNDGTYLNIILSDSKEIIGFSHFEKNKYFMFDYFMYGSTEFDSTYLSNKLRFLIY